MTQRRTAVAILTVLATGLGACGRAPANTQVIRSGGDPARGALIVGREACGACHQIPGVQQADGMVGPPLAHFASRTMIAGVLPNTPENLVHWMKSPQSVTPGNAMPDMGLSDQQARDVTAFLETLR